MPVYSALFVHLHVRQHRPARACPASSASSWSRSAAWEYNKWAALLHLLGRHLRRLVHDVDVPAGRLRPRPRRGARPARRRADRRRAGAAGWRPRPRPRPRRCRPWPAVARAGMRRDPDCTTSTSQEHVPDLATHGPTTITAGSVWPDLTRKELLTLLPLADPDDHLRRLPEADLRHRRADVRAHSCCRS